MPFGQYPVEKILLNEETIWARSEGFGMPRDSSKHLERVRELEAAGDYAGADQYFQDHVQNKKRPDSYQLLGWLNLEYLAGPLSHSRRGLDLTTGISTCCYNLEDGTKILQHIQVSAPDDVIVLRIDAAKPIDLRISLDGGVVEEGDILKAGAADGINATQYVGRARVIADGEVVISGASLEVKKSRKVTVYVSAATNFDRKNSNHMLGPGWQKNALKDLDALKGKSVDVIVQEAVEDHMKYFERVDVDFGKTAEHVLAMPTGERLQRIKDGAEDDPDLIEAYFQYGRYLLIGSSRPGSFPANLQGVWNPHIKAPWGSDYHLNINIQMNYWPAETTNLGELHTPLFDLIRYFQPAGRAMAKRLGMRGWCMGHSTDIWGHAQIMSERAYWGGSFFGGQWMAMHLLEHYRFNRDPDFLLKNWDLLTDSTRFVESWLIPGPEEGMLMARPSCSPENSFLYEDADGTNVKAALSAGNSFDQYMILQSFNDYIEAAEATGNVDDPFVAKIRDILPRVYRPKIGEDGRLMEWRLPFEEAEPGHRHMSHVLGAYPGNQINMDNDPVMREAVKNSIDYRLQHGGAKTGWSRAWTIGMFARFSDGEGAYENLIAILQKSTLDNLWDSHPPFQIDGNFGATAAIAEMLMHSHNNEIKLLPALPEICKEGHARGLRARGDFTVDIQWSNGTLEQVTVHGGDNALEQIPVVYRGMRRPIQVGPGNSVTLTGKDFE
jgi:alpha-L-fucosidase 2